MKTFLGWRLVGAGVLLGWLLASTDTASAQPPGAGEPEAKVPADTCILELTIPPKTQVTVDGKAQSNTRRITWPGLQRGKIYVSKLNFRFDNGATETRTVLVEAGRQLRLAVQHPQIARPKLALQVGHSKLPYGSAFSPDGKWIATTGGYGDNTAILWDRATGRQLRRMVHRDGVDAVAFTPDSQFAIVASATGKLLIWETATGAVKHELAAGDSWIPAGSLTAKEGYIAACDRSGTTHVWDASSRTLVCRLRLYPDNTAYFCTGWGVRLRPQTSHLVAHLTARESDRTAGFMTYDEFELRRRAAKTLDEIERLNDEFDRQTKEYELRRKEWSLLVQWDIASGAKLRTFHLPGYEFGRFAISPDGQLLVASCHSPRGAGAASEAANHFLVAWRLDDGREVARNTSTDRLTSLKFSRDGQHVRAWSEDKLIRFRATDLAEIEASRLPGVGELDTGFVHPDFECLLRWGYDERDRIFRMSCRSATEPVSAWTVDFHQGHALEFLPGQDWILSQSGGAVLMVDSATQRVVRTLYRPTNDRTLRGAGFFPDPGWVLVHTEIRRPQDPEPRPGEPVEAEFLVFDPRTGEQVRQFRLSDACEASHKRRLRQLQVSSDGEWALAATHDYQAVVLETATGKVVGRFQPMYRGDRLAVSNAVFVPGTGGVLVGAIGTNFPDQDPPQPFGYLWYPDTGDWRARLSVPSELLTFTSSFMAYLPQRRLVLAIGSASRHQPGASGIHELTGHCCLWSARGPIVHSYPAAAGMLRSGKSWLNPGARFEYRIENEHFLPPVVSPDERLLVLSDGEKDETEIVSIDSGSVLRTLPGMTTSFAYHERVLAMSDGTGTSALVDVSTGAEVARIVRLGSHDDWLAVTPEGLFDGTEKARQLVAFQIGDSTDLVPVDRFFQDFYRPGLLSAVFQGSRPLPDAAFAGSLPPRVRIVAPKEGGVVESSTVTVEIEATDRGGGIQGPYLRQNGSRLASVTHSERRDKTEFRRFSVNLVEGENRLEAWAKTADGSWESEPAAIVLRYEKPLPKPELYLVAVGISAYAQDNYKLKFASQDAKDFAELFRRRHNALYANAHIVEILDDQATKSNIQKALSEVAEKAQPQDTVILFLAGHGTMLGQRYYFLPHDFRSEPGGNLEQDVSRQGLPADVLGDFLLKGAALRRLLILDTCASGGAVDLFQVASRNPFSFRREIERLSKDSGAFVVAASAATEEAKEPAALKHGVLSYVLLAGMRAAQGGPLEGKWLVPSRSELVVDAVEWFTYAEGHVPRLTKEYCGQEQNVEVGRKGRSFPVLPVTDP